MSLLDQLWSPTSVQVTAVQARGLRAKGKHGTNDAYAVMQVGKEKFQTSVVEKSVAPVWKEEAAFELQPGGRSTLQVHVLHRALVGPDKLLGQAVVDLVQLSEDTTRDKTAWFKLLDKTGKSDKDRGEVLVDVQFMRNNMTSSMFDLSAAGKSRSRLGKFKDKVRGKKKESDASSATAPTFSQVLTDSEEEGKEDVLEAAGRDEEEEKKKKKHKMKSLFAPKSNLHKNLSQSMTVLPGKNSSLTGSQSSLNVDSSEGKKKFKFLKHKRSDSKDSQKQTEQSNLCINGSHIYCDEPQPRSARTGSNFSLASSGHGSMEDVPESSPPSVDSLRVVKECSPWTEEEEEAETSVNKMDYDEDNRGHEEEECFKSVGHERLEEIQSKEEEEQKSDEDDRTSGVQQNKVQNMLRRFEEKKKEKRKVRKIMEEKQRVDEIQVMESRAREEESIHQEKEKAEEEKRKQEQMEEERRREEEEERVQQMRDEEERLVEEKRRLEEEERRLVEERMQKEEAERVEQRRKEEEQKWKDRQEQLEKKRIQEEERKHLERIQKEETIKKEMEEKQQREEKERRQAEEERLRKEEEELLAMEEKRQEEEERKQIEEERIKKEQEKLREEERVRKVEEENLRKEMEERRQEEEERKRIEEERIKKEQEKLREEESVRKVEEENLRKEMEERRQEEEERKRIEEARIKKEQEKLREEERIRKVEEENLRKEMEERRQEEERKWVEEVRIQREKERFREEERIRKEEEEMKRQEKEEHLRREEEQRVKRAELLAERTRLEEEEKKRVEEERIKKEEEERLRKEQEERKRQEEEQAKLKEEERIKLEQQERRDEEERVRREQKLEEERQMMARRAEEEQKKRKDERNKLEEETEKAREEQKRQVDEEKRERSEWREENSSPEEIKRERRVVPQKTQIQTSPVDANVAADVPDSSKDPCEENISDNPFDEIPGSPAVLTVKPRCLSDSSDGSEAGSATDKGCAVSQRKKLPAPRPPGSPAVRLCQQDDSQAQMTKKHKETKSAVHQQQADSVPSLRLIPTETNTGDDNGPTERVQHLKGPAPSRPSHGLKSLSAESKSGCARSLNPFDEDDAEETPGSAYSTVHADAEAKTKSSKVTRAPKAPTNATSPSSSDPFADSLDVTETRDGEKQTCDPERDSGLSVSFLESPPHKSVPQQSQKRAQPPATPRRLQPVKPLNALEHQDHGQKSALVVEEQKNKQIKRAEVKGPYSLLTEEELVRLVQKQEQQLSARDKKIAELELYIDNLLVRVMEEQPSILMSMNSVMKPV